MQSIEPDRVFSNNLQETSTSYQPINGAMTDTPIYVCIVTIVMLELAMLDLCKLVLNVNKEATSRNSENAIISLKCIFV